MKCEECGGPTEYEFASCAGAEAEEREQGVCLASAGTQRLLSCNCCEECRAKCFKSWQEEQENQQ